MVRIIACGAISWLAIRAALSWGSRARPRGIDQLFALGPLISQGFPSPKCVANGISASDRNISVVMPVLSGGYGDALVADHRRRSK